MKKADLHIHTTYSDGTYAPYEVVRIAKDNGLSAIAITDHDITDGILPAVKAGAKLGIEVIPGIELSCEHNGVEIHILGYYINWENTWLQGKLKVFQKARERRAYYIMGKLKEQGIEIDEQMLFSQCSIGSISRVHFSRCLMEMGIVKNNKEAFEKYLGEGRSAFVPKLRITPQEALSMIHRVGGVPIVAHPVFGGGHKKFLQKLKRLGLSGIEAYHAGHTASQAKKFHTMAKEIGLIVTGGTDSHGSREEENPIGSHFIEYKYVEKLKETKHMGDVKNRVILAQN